MIIDADAHIEESEAMFEHLDKEFRPRRPLPVRLDSDTVYGKYNAVWLIDGETYPKMVGKGGTIFRTPTLMAAAALKRNRSRPGTDRVGARIKDMDRVKIDTQSCFRAVSDSNRRRWETRSGAAASYNSFSAHVRANRKAGFASLRWCRSATSRNRPKRFGGAKLGAAAGMLSMAWDNCGREVCFLSTKRGGFEFAHLRPLRLGCPALTRIFDASTNFYSAILPVIMGFNSIMSSAAFEKIPNCALVP